MLEEVPTKPPYDKDASKLKPQIRHYTTMLYLFKVLLTKVPEWFVVDNKPSDLLGFPFNIILDWPMGTKSGRDFFLDPRVNKCIMNVLNAWGTYLKKKDGGNQALLDAGWSKPEAIQTLEKKANEVDDQHRKFTEIFEHPADGKPTNFFKYSCWDDFFTRKFRKGIRPISPWQVVNACESHPLFFDRDVSRRNKFWLKGAPYSLADMFGSLGNKQVAGYVDKFVGGTVYQAFLSADSYHCWNAPVDGKVVYRNTIPGTYYAETEYAGFGSSDGPDPAGPDRSQRYITQVAARGVLIIDSNEGGADLGLVAFIPVGMAEVSTIEWNDSTNVGKTLKKGDLIGAFHGGSSTHCLIFERQASERLKFNPFAEFPDAASKNLGVSSDLACCDETYAKTLPIRV